MGMEQWILKFRLDLAGMIVTMDVSYYMNRRLVLNILLLFSTHLYSSKRQSFVYGVKNPK